MRIGVIGAGEHGTTLARLCVRAGHEVSIANSRGPQTLADAAADVGAVAVAVPGAVAHADVVIISIPSKAVPALAGALSGHVGDDTVLIDTCNYHPELRDGRIDAIDGGMPDSEWVSRQIGRPVIKAFNNMLATSLRDKPAPRGNPERLALPVAGDAIETRSTALGLVEDLGFDAVDAGGLADSWRQQPGAPAYLHHLDAAALRRALAEAEHHLVAEYRVREEDRIKRAIAASAEAGSTA